MTNDIQQHEYKRDKYPNAKFYRTRDQRSPMDTMFTAQDIEKHTKSNRMEWRMKRALSLQEGQWVQTYDDMDSRQSQNIKEWKRRTVHIICDNADMNHYQMDRVQHVLDSLPSINKFGPYRTEEVIIGIVLYVMEKEGERFQHDVEYRDRDVFKSLCEKYDTTVDRAEVAYNNVVKYYEGDDDDE